MEVEKICESCGMQLRAPEDFGGGDLTNRYCKHCTDEKGNLKDFDSRLEDLVRFIMSRTGVDRDEAVRVGRESMAKMPAWKAYFRV